MKTENVEKLATKLHDKTENVIHVRNLKPVLNHGLILKKVHRVIKFNQKSWLKPYIDMIFLDSTKLKDVWKKITTFLKRCVSIIL